MSLLCLRGSKGERSPLHPSPPRPSPRYLRALVVRPHLCRQWRAFGAIAPRFDDVPDHVTKQTYRGNTLSTSTVVNVPKPPGKTYYMVEVVRSCPELCRFCLASYLTLRSAPPRLKPA